MNTKIIAILAVVVLLVMAGALTGCKKKETAPVEPTVTEPVEPTQPVAEPEPVVPEGATIELSKFDISEADVTVEAGATVTWVNKGEVKHKIQVKLGKEILESSEMLEEGDEYSYTFEEAGDYSWLSGPYAGIVKGTVTVE
ncbi:hypothetical protein KY328_04260 [Candidatus Woesearchaeota archaeon]|nr:hypothetical protein [Candidatus Woesearchaeota archaeon]MBW3022112.1 hypothetical protein [Candidatus Woesearchaeota archaeon]